MVANLYGRLWERLGKYVGHMWDTLYGRLWECLGKYVGQFVWACLGKYVGKFCMGVPVSS